MVVVVELRGAGDAKCRRGCGLPNQGATPHVCPPAGRGGPEEGRRPLRRLLRDQRRHLPGRSREVPARGPRVQGQQALCVAAPPAGPPVGERQRAAGLISALPARCPLVFLCRGSRREGIPARWRVLREFVSDGAVLTCPPHDDRVECQGCRGTTVLAHGPPWLQVKAKSDGEASNAYVECARSHVKAGDGHSECSDRASGEGEGAAVSGCRQRGGAPKASG